MSQAVVQLRNAVISQAGRDVLRGVNLTIAAGEFIYLIGKTGSGKSSLLKTLYAALPLRQGEGMVAGFDLRAIRRPTFPKLRRQLGIVFQDLNLLTDRSVADNLHFVLRATGWRKVKERDRRIAEVLHSVGLPAVAGKYPQALSGGEQQRVAFARALLNEPALLIADEITGNLDPTTSEQMLGLMQDLCRTSGTAILFATHDYRLLEHYQARTLLCQNGSLVPDHIPSTGY